MKIKSTTILAAVVAAVIGYFGFRIVSTLSQMNQDNIRAVDRNFPAAQSEPRIQQTFVTDVSGTIVGQPSSFNKSSETYMVKVDDEPGVVRMWSVTTIKGTFRAGDRVHCSKNNQRVVIDATGYQSPVTESIACDLSESRSSQNR